MTLVLYTFSVIRVAAYPRAKLFGCYVVRLRSIPVCERKQFPTYKDISDADVTTDKMC